MKDVWLLSDSIVSPLGGSSEENYKNILLDNTGIRKINGGPGDREIHASLLEDVAESPSLSRFENLSLRAAKGALQNFTPDPERTLLIVSTTKGNISLLRHHRDHARISLHATARYIADNLGLRHTLVISNACISGVLALIAAGRFLQTGQYDHALVIGAEEISPFIIAGFNSLQALSKGACKPFDKDRNGISLGEAAGAILLTNRPEAGKGSSAIRLSGSGASNDANHISGPSRTGEELALAITRALRSAGLDPSSIDAVCAHGTATLFNDEMEAKALASANLETTPLFSLKGYFGHTLGAAGVIETIISKHALMQNMLIASKGYRTPGVSTPVKVIERNESKPLRRLLKTASGFGGCNAAVVLEKMNLHR